MSSILIPRFRCSTPPTNSRAKILLYTKSISITTSKSKHCPSDARLRRTATPNNSLVIIWRFLSSINITQSKIIHRLRISCFRRATKPNHRSTKIRRSFKPSFITHRLYISRLRRTTKPISCLCNPCSVCVTNTKIAHCSNLSFFRCPTIPTYGFVIILRDANSIVVTSAKIKHCLPISRLRRTTPPTSCLCKIL